jgi:FKBP-type peptidyl-prolyl cis-trans isomerase FkpA
MQARLFVLAFASLVLVTACGRNEKPDAPAAASESAPASGADTDAPSDTTSATPGAADMALQKTDLTPGNGAEIKSGQTALVHYTGWLYESGAPDHKGKQFDSSMGGEPFEFQLGAGHVIPGWDQGVVGMTVGGKRHLVIPPDMGYGARGAGNGLIPPGATLVFDVELVEIR